MPTETASVALDDNGEFGYAWYSDSYCTVETFPNEVDNVDGLLASMGSF